MTTNSQPEGLILGPPGLEASAGRSDLSTFGHDGGGTSYAQVTLAISDECAGGLEGFAPLSDPLPASVFADAIEDGQSMDESGYHYSIFLDLMDRRDETQIGEKCISLAQAAEILKLPAEGLVSLGRQRLAQLNDEADAYVSAKAGVA